MNILRNAILIALPFDATAEEVAAAHSIIDSIHGGVDPSVLVHGTYVPGEGVTTGGNGEAIPPNNSVDGGNAEVEVDKNGVPWDERIHSSSKENRLNADGTWRAKRGVDKAYAKRIEAQLLAARSATPPAAPAPAAAAPAAAAAPPMPGGNKPPMPGAAAETPYASLLKFIASNTKSDTNPNGMFDSEYVSAILVHFGVPDGSLQTLAHSPQLVQPVRDWLESVLNGTGG